MAKAKKVTEVVAVEVQAPEVEAPKSERELVAQFDIQLKIHQMEVLSLFPETRSILVENLDGGTVLIGEDKEPLESGKSKDFEGLDHLILRSASRPTVRVKQFK